MDPAHRRWVQQLILQCHVLLLLGQLGRCCQSIFHGMFMPFSHPSIRAETKRTSTIVAVSVPSHVDCFFLLPLGLSPGSAVARLFFSSWIRSSTHDWRTSRSNQILPAVGSTKRSRKHSIPFVFSPSLPRKYNTYSYVVQSHQQVDNHPTFEKDTVVWHPVDIYLWEVYLTQYYLFFQKCQSIDLNFVNFCWLELHIIISNFTSLN